MQRQSPSGMETKLMQSELEISTREAKPNEDNVILNDRLLRLPAELRLKIFDLIISSTLWSKLPGPLAQNARDCANLRDRPWKRTVDMENYLKNIVDAYTGLAPAAELYEVLDGNEQFYIADLKRRIADLFDLPRQLDDYQMCLYANREMDCDVRSRLWDASDHDFHQRYLRIYREIEEKIAGIYNFAALNDYILKILDADVAERQRCLKRRIDVHREFNRSVFHLHPCLQYFEPL